MKLQRDKLDQTARLRFPNDDKAQASYVSDVLAASDVVTETHYEISDAAFRRLQDKYGSRPRLPAKPTAPTKFQLVLADARASVCSGCEHFEGVTREKNGYPVHSVKCGACGCGGLSLIRGKCPTGEWDKAIEIDAPDQG